MPDDIHIDERLLVSSDGLADLALCHARLQLDARWPWIVLIPRRAGLTELEQLAPADREVLFEEIAAAGAAVRAVGAALDVAVDKLNIGALGNVVPQLHLHVIGRRRDDPAWPGPVWGFGDPEPYSAAALERARAAAAPHLLEHPVPAV
ncbi:MAG TPA: HIT domain-containing protein [Caulobacteraceae bacterium]|jgi:diadenosine tetraphosphate (Ap4A) HIT family hydrolase